MKFCRKNNYIQLHLILLWGHFLLLKKNGLCEISASFLIVSFWFDYAHKPHQLGTLSVTNIVIIFTETVNVEDFLKFVLICFYTKIYLVLEVVTHVVFIEWNVSNERFPYICSGDYAPLLYAFLHTFCFGGLPVLTYKVSQK